MQGILQRFTSNGNCDSWAASQLLSMAACSALAAGVALGASQAHATTYNATTSTNWAGYVATAGTGQNFTSVLGSWQVPTVTSSTTSTTNTYSAFWVGLDGYSDGTVEQLGTSGIGLAGGGAYYYAWYEMYPQFSIPIGMPVAAGDWMNASVTYEGGAKFRLSMQDTTTGAIFSIDQTSTFDQGQFASSDLRTSAEWIAESPGIVTSSGGTISSLANFGTVTFTGASATLYSAGASTTTSGTISNFTNSAIQLVSGVGGLSATPSPLNGYGNGFTVTVGGAAPAGSQLTVTSNSGYHQGMGIKGFATPIPEPGVLPLMALAGLALTAARRRYRQDMVG